MDSSSKVSTWKSLPYSPRTGGETSHVPYTTSQAANPPFPRPGHRMVYSKSTLCRTDCKMESAEERAFNKFIAGADDTARPGSSCSHAMGDRQIVIDQLAACDLEVLIALWDLEEFYDTIPFKLIRSEEGVPVPYCCHSPHIDAARVAHVDQGLRVILRDHSTQRQWSCSWLSEVQRHRQSCHAHWAGRPTRVHSGQPWCNNSLLHNCLEVPEASALALAGSDHDGNQGGSRPGGHETPAAPSPILHRFGHILHEPAGVRSGCYGKGAMGTPTPSSQTTLWTTR